MLEASKNISNFCIYILQNRINNKIYVGQTNSVKKRLEKHKMDSKSSRPSMIISRALNKYGFENFNFILIEENLSLEDANYWEVFYIQFFQSKNKLFGYNLKDGGKNSKHSQITKDKISAWHKGRPGKFGDKNPFFGLKHTDETKEKISKANSGRVVSSEIKLKISLATTGEKNANSKLNASDVLKMKNEYNLGGTSYKILSKKYNISKTQVARIINGETWKSV